MSADSSSLWTLLGFGGLLLLLLMILKEGKPRTMPTVVQRQTPQQWTDDPKFAEARRKAVAAAFAYHQQSTSKGPTK
ncbi:hypothetical protein P0Y35_02180 [Kiritimatiellaeota bacterium B1221]|nr:hypothetical protein [Kiritimatiellaeota bacterium B1221]